MITAIFITVGLLVALLLVFVVAICKAASTYDDDYVLIVGDEEELEKELENDR